MPSTAALALTALTLLPGASLELEDCRISAGDAFPSIKALCGRLTRPLDPARPDAGSIELNIAVVPALNLEPEADPVVPLAGGPGQGAIQFYASWAHAFEPVRRNRDILLVDQRGTGDSARMDCEVGDELVEGQYTLAQTREATQECLEALPHDPRFFTTSIAVQDLEAVRIALGYPALNIYGVSYGSRVAQHYARRYPDAVRTITLDGVVPAGLPLGPEIAIEAELAIDNIIARCANDKACSERFPELGEQFEELKSRLSARSVSIDLTHPLTGRPESLEFGRNEFAGALRLLAYDQSSIALLPLLISEAHAGRYQPLAAQFLMTMASLSDMLALGMHNSILCSEDAPFFDSVEVDRPGLEASYMGALQYDAITAICGEWPAGPIDEDFHQPLATDTPALLLSGDADPITPPRYADMAAIGLKKAWLITGRDQGHGQLGIGCMPRLYAEFVTGRGLDDVDLSCFDKSFVMPFFLDFTGPQP